MCKGRECKCYNGNTEGRRVLRRRTAAPPAKSLWFLAGGVIGVKQTVFNTQELELPRSFGRWILILVLSKDILGGLSRIFVYSRILDLDSGFYE